MTPERPVAAFFDSAADAWILSRYAEVLAAFRDPRLWTINGSGADQMEVRDDSGKLSARAEMLEALALPKVQSWQKDFEQVVATQLAALPRDRDVDLLRELALPCCLELAIRLTGADPADTEMLGDLGSAAFGGTGAAPDSQAKIEAVEATAVLTRYYEGSAFRMGEPTFVGTSQTMARLLASGWVAMLSHPAECQRLRDNEALIPSAVEELLRYAGIVPTLYRRAQADVEIGGAAIAQGQRVHLRIASANRDPEQFPDPDRLDVGRRAVSHLALGIGRNSCVGNLVIRMASAVMTAALVRTFPAAKITGTVEWRTSPSFQWPDAIPVRLC